MTGTEPQPAGRRRALLVTTDFPPARGGIQTMAREVLARASRTEFRVIAPAADGAARADAESVDAALADVIGSPVRRVGTMGLGRRGAIAAMTLAARTEAKRWAPDVVLSLHVLASPGVLLAGTPRPPLVVVTHGGELRSPRIRRVARWVFPRAERVVANSRFTRTEAIALGAEPMKTTVLPVGAPDPVGGLEPQAEALRQRLGWKRIVLSVARLEPHKGHDRLIRALAALEDDAGLVLVGEGSERARLERTAADAGVAARVVFAGVAPDDELPVYYTAADAFALLSRDTHGPRAGVEGGGIALLEACAYGLPVVAAATGGIPETIREDETGLLVNPDDGPAVARALRRVLEDRALATRLGAAGKVMATGERSWARFVERMETVLELASRRSREVVG